MRTETHFVYEVRSATETAVAIATAKAWFDSTLTYTMNTIVAIGIVLSIVGDAVMFCNATIGICISYGGVLVMLLGIAQAINEHK